MLRQADGWMRIVCLFVLLAAGGCAYYSFGGGVVGDIRTLAVPLARNETAEAGLAEQLTNYAEQAYAADGRLRLVDEESAEGILYLWVRQVEDRPFTYSADEVTEQYRFRMQVQAEFVRMTDMEVVLELPELSGWGTYDAAAADDNGREAAVGAAVQMITEELLGRSTSSW